MSPALLSLCLSLTHTLSLKKKKKQWNDACEVPSTERLPPCHRRRREANLVRFVDVGVHTVLDHLLHQQGVGLVADLSKPERKGCQGLRGPIWGGAPTDQLGGHWCKQPLSWLSSSNSPANTTRFGNVPLTTR